MFMSYSLVVNLVLVLSGVGLNFLPSSLSVIQQEIFKKTARCSYLRQKKFLFTFWNKGNLVILKRDFNLIKYFTNKIKLVWFSLVLFVKYWISIDILNLWNYISATISEYCSQKYLNFNDISRKCTLVSRPLWSLLLWEFLLWFLLNIKIFIINKIVNTIFAHTMQCL